MNSHSFLNQTKNDRSKNLTDRENIKIIDQIESTNGVCISMAICQVFLTKRPENSEWYKHSTGILCLVKDYDKKSFFFRLYNLNAQILWEEEISTLFAYHKITKNFFYFAGYCCNVGLNFAFEEEAFKFQRSIIRAINSLEKLDYLKTDPNNNNTNQKTLNYNCKKDKKAEKKVIKKNLIGKPMDFVHLNHIGVNENNSFKILLNDQNEHVKMIVDVFKQLNIKPNKQSVEYADSFIKSNGGYSKYFKEYKKGMAPKPPKFESKSDIPKKNPKVVISNFEETKNLVQPNKTSMNFSTTPNTLKPPSRPPPKPPVYQQDNKLETNITHNKSEFLSPVSSGQKYESDGSNYVTPETQNVNNDNINIIQVRQVSSAHEEPRSALLKSIENFKGGLRRVTDQRENIKISPKFNENDPMSQLIKALGEIRPFLNQSSDESDDEDENFSF